ncbi:MAG: hypothetical protein AB9869_38420 [Verrucomicrobiia bacterium]
MKHELVSRTYTLPPAGVSGALGGVEYLAFATVPNGGKMQLVVAEKHLT